MSTPSSRRAQLQKGAALLLTVALGLAIVLLFRAPFMPWNKVERRAGDPESKAYLSQDDPTVQITDLPPRRWKIVDVHEHLLDTRQAERLLPAMDKLGVQRTCTLAATKYTFTLDKRYGYEGWEENDEEVLKIKARWPDRFCAFVTIDPEQPDALQKLQGYVARGADGLKLYLGHGESHGKGPFHVMPLDDPRMEPIYAWAEATQLPIVYHVNLIRFWDEFLRVMEAHPYLRVDVAHFGLHKTSAARLTRLAFLLDRYPYLYTDISFGYYTFQSEGFESLAKWRTRSKEFLTQHKDRFLYASDMVLEPMKEEDYIYDTLRSYMQLLETDRFRLFLMPDKLMHGLQLDDDALTAIYERTPASFLLTDSQGALPDRTHGWPVPGTPEPARPPVPPLSTVVVPPEK